MKMQDKINCIWENGILFNVAGYLIPLILCFYIVPHPLREHRRWNIFLIENNEFVFFVVSNGVYLTFPLTVVKQYWPRAVPLNLLDKQNSRSKLF